ncbi:CesT family type III secretion system chaperone [Mailhella massiliensis]|uniref:CesT family type III secretion system chaperone n=1 Tax=Mailhella massiliensis TaxID=1903261 RepID=UPI00097DA641|nr:CesT family type III secretion system chaperone [Mailhella massiliensis]
MLDHEMEAFGRRLGLESLSFSSEGVARLDIANIGSFYLEKAEHDGRREILAYLSAPLPEHDTGAIRRLLSLCNYRHALPMPLYAGVFSGRGMLLTRMDEDGVTAASLENALRFLADLMHGA